MITGPEGVPSFSHDYLNQRAAEMSETQAWELRDRAITLVHEAFSVFLKDDATMDTGYLTLDFLASPGLTQDEYEDALSYKLVRTKPRAPSDDFGADRIQMFLPVPRDFHLDGEEVSDLPELNETKEVYVKFEKDRPDGVHIRRFVISRDGVYEYVTETDPDYEEETSDILGRELHNMSTGTQKLSMLMVAQLLEDHRNFSVVPQIADTYTA